MEFQLALNPALRGYVEDGAFRGNIKYMLFVKFNFYSRRSPKQFVQFFFRELSMYRKGKSTYSGKCLNNQDIIVQHEIF